LGEKLRESLLGIIAGHGLSRYITIKGHPCWQLLLFRDHNGQICDGYKTLMFQEAIRRGLLFRGSFVFSLAHTEVELNKTTAAFDKMCKVYKKAINAGDYKKFLVGEPVKPVFRKFN